MHTVCGLSRTDATMRLEFNPADYVVDGIDDVILLSTGRRRGRLIGAEVGAAE